MSALLKASGMTDWSKITFIDTEKHSAEFYSYPGVLQLEKHSYQKDISRLLKM